MSWITIASLVLSHTLCLRAATRLCLNIFTLGQHWIAQRTSNVCNVHGSKGTHQNSGILLNALPNVSSMECSSASDAGSISMGGVRAAPLPTYAPPAEGSASYARLAYLGRMTVLSQAASDTDLYTMQGSHHVTRAVQCSMHTNAHRVQPHPTVAVVPHSALAPDVGASRIDHDLDGLLRVYLST